MRSLTRLYAVLFLVCGGSMAPLAHAQGCLFEEQTENIFGFCQAPFPPEACSDPTNDPTITVTPFPGGCPRNNDLIGVCDFSVDNQFGQQLFYYFGENLDGITRQEAADILRTSCESSLAGVWNGEGNNIFPPVLDPELTSSDPGQVTCGSQSAGGQPVANCSGSGNNERAEADVRNATVKVLATGSGGDFPASATGQIVDLVTITKGFDGNGMARGTFELDLDGMVTTSIGSATFRALVWYPGRAAPQCIDDPNECNLTGGDFAFADLEFSVSNGQVQPFDFATMGGVVQVGSANPNDLRATLTVPWEVSEDSPSFFVGVFGEAFVSSGNTGVVDFFNTAKGGFTGPPGYGYSGKRGIAATGANAEQPTDPVRLSGGIRNIDGQDITALVLASGRFQFSNQPVGRFDLSQLPRESDGGVRRQIYASGFVPKIEVIRGSTAEPVTLASAGQCPNFNPVSNPAARPQSAGQRHRLSGRVLVQNTTEPIRAMVLVNGQFDFADANGDYSVEFPLDSQGQFTRQVYASGFAPSIEKYDQSTTTLDIRLARAAQCQ